MANEKYIREIVREEINNYMREIFSIESTNSLDNIKTQIKDKIKSIIEIKDTVDTIKTKEEKVEQTLIIFNNLDKLTVIFAKQYKKALDIIPVKKKSDILETASEIFNSILAICTKGVSDIVALVTTVMKKVVNTFIDKQEVTKEKKVEEYITVSKKVSKGISSFGFDEDIEIDPFIYFYDIRDKIIALKGKILSGIRNNNSDFKTYITPLLKEINVKSVDSDISIAQLITEDYSQNESRWRKIEKEVFIVMKRFVWRCYCRKHWRDNTGRFAVGVNKKRLTKNKKHCMSERPSKWPEKVWARERGKWPTLLKKNILPDFDNQFSEAIVQCCQVQQCGRGYFLDISYIEINYLDRLSSYINSNSKIKSLKRQYISLQKQLKDKKEKPKTENTKKEIEDIKEAIKNQKQLIEKETKNAKKAFIKDRLNNNNININDDSVADKLIGTCVYKFLIKDLNGLKDFELELYNEARTKGGGFISITSITSKGTKKGKFGFSKITEKMVFVNSPGIDGIVSPIKDDTEIRVVCEIHKMKGLYNILGRTESAFFKICKYKGDIKSDIDNNKKNVITFINNPWNRDSKYELIFNQQIAEDARDYFIVRDGKPTEEEKNRMIFAKVTKFINTTHSIRFICNKDKNKNIDIALYSIIVEAKKSHLIGVRDVSKKKGIQIALAPWFFIVYNIKSKDKAIKLIKKLKNISINYI